MALDDRLKRVYDAGATALSQQDTTLSNLRNRSTAVITIAGLVTSFSAGLGLINTKAATGSVFPSWGAFSLIGLLAAIAVLTLYVLWPVTQFAFGPSSAIMYERYNANEAEETTVKFVVEAMNTAQSTNEGRIHHRMQAFEAASALLFVEFVVEVIAIFSKLVDQGTPLWKLTQNPRTSPRPVRTRTTRQAARRLNAGEVLTLVEAYQDGATTYELAKHYDIHRGTVSEILERHGIPRRYNLLGGEKLARAIGLYEDGKS